MFASSLISRWSDGSNRSFQCDRLMNPSHTQVKIYLVQATIGSNLSTIRGKYLHAVALPLEEAIASIYGIKPF